MNDYPLPDGTNDWKGHGDQPTQIQLTPTWELSIRVQMICDKLEARRMGEQAQFYEASIEDLERDLAAIRAELETR